MIAHVYETFFESYFFRISIKHHSEHSCLYNTYFIPISDIMQWLLQPWNRYSWFPTKSQSVSSRSRLLWDFYYNFKKENKTPGGIYFCWAYYYYYFPSIHLKQHLSASSLSGQDAQLHNIWIWEGKEIGQTLIGTFQLRDILKLKLTAPYHQRSTGCW